MRAATTGDGQFALDLDLTVGPDQHQPKHEPSIEELRRAWVALRAGQFSGPEGMGCASRVLPGRLADDPRRSVWLQTPSPTQRVVPVIGCTGSTGATTLAVALAATAASEAGDAARLRQPVSGSPAAASRVVECCTRARSGLSAAGSVEVGTDLSGLWQLARRDESNGQVLLQRLRSSPRHPDEVPTISLPVQLQSSSVSGSLLTVLDCGWELAQLFSSPAWDGVLDGAVQHVVLTTTATVPGLRFLDSALDFLDHDRVVVAVLGPKPSRWPGQVRHAMTRRVSRMQADGRLVAVPMDKSLAVEGLTQRPLPERLLIAARALLTQAQVASGPSEPERPDVEAVADGWTGVSDAGLDVLTGGSDR